MKSQTPIRHVSFRSALWMLLLLTLSCLLEPVSAQTDTNPLYILVTLSDGPVAYQDDLFQQIQAHFQPLGIEPQIITMSSDAIPAPFWDKYPVVDMRLSSNQFSIYPTTPFHFPQSSLLQTSYDFGIILDVDTDHLDEAAAVVTALGFYAQGNYAQASQYFQAAGAHQDLTGPHFAESIAFFQGNAALMQDHLDEAARYLEKALTDLSRQPYAVLNPSINLSWVYLQLGRNDDAFNIMADLVIRAFNILPPDSPASDWHTDFTKTTILEKRARLYLLASRYDDAITDMNTVIQLASASDEWPFYPGLLASYYVSRGQMYLHRSEWDKVLADYNKAIELDSSNADAYFDRGVLYYSILQTSAEYYPALLADFQRYLELAPSGEHAADAQKYADQIQAQQNALGK